MDIEIIQKFDKIDQNFDEMRQNFNEMNQKFDLLLDAVKDGFDDVYNRFDKVDGRLDKVEGRLDNVEHDVKVVKATMVTKDFLTRNQTDFKVEVQRRIRLVDDREKLFSKKLVEYLKESKALKTEHAEELEEMIM